MGLSWSFRLCKGHSSATRSFLMFRLEVFYAQQRLAHQSHHPSLPGLTQPVQGEPIAPVPVGPLPQRPEPSERPRLENLQRPRARRTRSLPDQDSGLHFPSLRLLFLRPGMLSRVTFWFS